MNSQLLKYQSLIEELEHKLKCNFENFSENERECFRFTFDSIDNEKNFLPVYVLAPRRLKDSMRNGSISCIGFALSFYQDKESAIRSYKDMVDRKPNLSKKLGTHLAKGLVKEEDGISDEANVKSHFSFFEYEISDIKDRFEVIQQLYAG